MNAERVLGSQRGWRCIWIGGWRPLRPTLLMREGKVEYALFPLD
jgi:hypothetical protein